MTISDRNILRMRTIPGKSCGEYQNTYYMIKIFFLENRAFCGIMKKNVDSRRLATDGNQKTALHFA